jgi:hypothetical protein
MSDCLSFDRVLTRQSFKHAQIIFDAQFIIFFKT